MFSMAYNIMGKRSSSVAVDNIVSGFLSTPHPTRLLISCLKTNDYVKYYFEKYWKYINFKSRKTRGSLYRFLWSIFLAGTALKVHQ